MGRRRRRRGILQELRETTTEKNIEPFTGTDDVGKYVGHFDGLQRTNASSASRSAAHGANSLREWSPQRLRAEGKIHSYPGESNREHEASKA